MADTYDVIVIGGGAAATSAALTLLNRGKSVGVVCNKAETSSQLSWPSSHGRR